MKLVITARSFGSDPGNAFRILSDAGFTVLDRSDSGIASGSTEEEVAAVIGDAEAAIIGQEPIGETVFACCPSLRFLSKRAVGCDTLDLAACRRHGVIVAVAAGTVEAAVAEHVMACILYFSRFLHVQSASMHAHEWNRVPLPGAKGRTVGLIGFGNIGKEVAKRAAPFGMRVLYYCRHPLNDTDSPSGAAYLPLDDLLAQSDYVVLAVPLNNTTRGMIGARELGLLRPEAVLINVARSRVVDNKALAAALREQRLRGAAVDVFDSEPCTDSLLHGLDNCLLTPHTAVYTTENTVLMNERAARNIADAVNGTLDKKYLVL